MAVPARAERAGEPARARPRPASQRVERKRARAQPRVAGGVVWIAIIAVLLTGVVAMNVAVLRLNLQLDGLGRERTKLRADNASIASKLSSASAAPQIQSIARGQGFVPAESAATTYIRLHR